MTRSEVLKLIGLIIAFGTIVLEMIFLHMGLMILSGIILALGLIGSVVVCILAERWRG